MKLKEKISWLRGRLQLSLFPCLEDYCVPPDAAQSRHIPSSHDQPLFFYNAVIFNLVNCQAFSGEMSLYDERMWILIRLKGKNYCVS